MSSSPPQAARHGLEPAGELHVRVRKRLSRF